MVTDFDCWHPDHDHVSVDQVIKVLLGNAGKGRDLVKQLVHQLPKDTNANACGCKHSLEYALITAPHARNPAMMEKLSVVAGRVLKR